MKYPELIQQHFFNPYHVGEWPTETRNVISAKSGTYAFGAVLQLQVLSENNKINEARFKVFGNPYLIACASFISQWLEGKSWQEVKSFNYQLLVEALELPIAQHHCAIITESAIELLCEDSMKQNIDITPAAQIFLQQLLQKKENAQGIFLGVDNSGCSGMSYVLETTETIDPEHLAFDFDKDIKLFMDKKSFIYLKGTVIDCVTEGLNKKIVFRNPNAQNTCGCGESFSI